MDKARFNIVRKENRITPLLEIMVLGLEKEKWGRKKLAVIPSPYKFHVELATKSQL